MGIIPKSIEIEHEGSEFNFDRCVLLIMLILRGADECLDGCVGRIT